MIIYLNLLYLGKVILEATALIAAVAISLTLYTFWAAKRGQDFRFLGPVLFATVIVMVFYWLIQIFIPLGKVRRTIYSGIAIVLFSTFFVYDTDNLIKRHNY